MRRRGTRRARRGRGNGKRPVCQSDMPEIHQNPRILQREVGDIHKMGVTGCGLTNRYLDVELELKC